MVAVAVVVVVAAGASLAPGRARATTGCDAPHPTGKVTQAPTLTQTFTPADDVVAAGWEVLLGFSAPFSGDVTTRIVYSPDPPIDAGVRLEGYELAAVTVAVTASAGDRQWIRFDPPEPVGRAPIPLPGDYGIQLDLAYPDGPVHWAECGVAYDGGSAYTSETFATSGAGLGGLPTVARLASSDVDLAFRLR